MVQVLPEREQSATPSLESLRKQHCKQLPTHTRTHQHLPETNSASICEKPPTFPLDQGGKQSSYPGVLCTKPRTTASIQRSGTHSTSRQHILCQIQSDLVRSIRRGTKTPRISSEVEEKTGKYTRIGAIVLKVSLQISRSLQDEEIQCTVRSS